MAVETGPVKAGQLKEANAEQSDNEISGRPYRITGRIFLGHGWMTPRNIDKALDILIMT